MKKQIVAILSLIILWPVVAAANYASFQGSSSGGGGGGGGSTSCPYGVLADGCTAGQTDLGSGLTVAGPPSASNAFTIQHADFFTSFALQSGQTFSSPAFSASISSGVLTVSGLPAATVATGSWAGPTLASPGTAGATSITVATGLSGIVAGLGLLDTTTNNIIGIVGSYSSGTGVITLARPATSPSSGSSDGVKFIVISGKETITGSGIPAGVYVSSFGTGTGANGTYNLANAGATSFSGSAIAVRRPPWNVAGVDYPVGVRPAYASSLLDPSTATLPPGCVFNSKATLGYNAVVCNTTGKTNVTVQGFNFASTAQGCVALEVDSGGTGTLIISDNVFGNGPECWPQPVPKTIATGSWTTASTTITVGTGITGIINCPAFPNDAAATACSVVRDTDIAAGPGQVIGGVKTYNSGTGVITLWSAATSASVGSADHISLINYPNLIANGITFANATSFSSSRIEYNYADIDGTNAMILGGDINRWIIQGSGTNNTMVAQYNAATNVACDFIMQNTGGGGVNGTLVNLYNYADGEVYEWNMGVAKFPNSACHSHYSMQFAPSNPGPTAIQDFNTFLWTAAGEQGTSMIYPSSSPSTVFYPLVNTYNNVLVSNQMTHFPTLANPMWEVGHSGVTVANMKNNYFGSDKSNYFTYTGNAASGQPTMSGNIDMGLGGSSANITNNAACNTGAC